MSVIDLGAVRFKAAGTADKTSPRDALVEAIRRIESGEWQVHSLMIIGLNTSPDGDSDLDLMDTMHAGPASSNERLGMFVRAQRMMLRDMFGED